MHRHRRTERSPHTRGWNNWLSRAIGEHRHSARSYWSEESSSPAEVSNAVSPASISILVVMARYGVDIARKRHSNPQVCRPANRHLRFAILSYRAQAVSTVADCAIMSNEEHL